MTQDKPNYAKAIIIGCILSLFILSAFWFLHMESRINEIEEKWKVKTLSLAYVTQVEEHCYKVHNPDNNITNYRESWGSAYRLCLRNNLCIEEGSCQ
jgi:hypothetical protein